MFDKEKCRVCETEFPEETWKNVELQGTYEGNVGEWGMYKDTLVATITLYICPHCGAVFTDWGDY